MSGREWAWKVLSAPSILSPLLLCCGLQGGPPKIAVQSFFRQNSRRRKVCSFQIMHFSDVPARSRRWGRAGVLALSPIDQGPEQLT